MIAHLYEDLGLDFVHRLNGQFAIALYDGRRRRLVLARDRVGIAPLHYTVAGGRLIFASEIKAVLAHPGVRREVDPTGLDMILTLPGLVSPRTMFAGISSLPPGHLLVLDDHGLVRRQYWDLDYPDAGELTAVDDAAVRGHLEGLEESLAEAIRLRTHADVPHAFYLSGGLDSSLLLGMAARSNGHDRPRTFSTVFDDARSERRFQQLLADELKTEHTELELTADGILDNLVSTVDHAECPLKGTHNVASYLLSGVAHAHGFKVVLTGEGADELFGGYLGYQFDRKRSTAGAGDRVPDAEEQARDRLWGNPRLAYGPNIAGLYRSRRELYSRSLVEQLADFDCLVQPLVDHDRLRGRHIFHQRSYLDFKLRLADHLLSDEGDRMAMAHSVETRFPFLDPHVIDRARAIPPDLMLRNSTAKYPLRRIADRYLPPSIVGRRKFSFQSFTGRELVRLDKSWVSSYLSPRRIEREGFFDPGTVATLRAKYADREFSLADVFAEDDLLTTVVTHGIFLECFQLPGRG
ncbi:asparagine synthase (glutamine-hydrolyzing) [Kribbella albertanoniae]